MIIIKKTLEKIHGSWFKMQYKLNLVQSQNWMDWLFYIIIYDNMHTQIINSKKLTWNY